MQDRTFTAGSSRSTLDEGLKRNEFAAQIKATPATAATGTSRESVAIVRLYIGLLATMTISVNAYANREAIRPQLLTACASGLWLLRRKHLLNEYLLALHIEAAANIILNQLDAPRKVER